MSLPSAVVDSLQHAEELRTVQVDKSQVHDDAVAALHAATEVAKQTLQDAQDAASAALQAATEADELLRKYFNLAG